MKSKEQFAILENTNIWPIPVILHLPTGVVGYPRLIKHEDSELIDKAIEDIAQQRTLGAKVAGYSIFISYSGTIAGDTPSQEERLAIVKGMAEFFASYKIKPRSNKYVRYSDNYYKGCPGDWKPLTPEQLAIKKAKKNRLD